MEVETRLRESILFSHIITTATAIAMELPNILVVQIIGTMYMEMKCVKIKLMEAVDRLQLIFQMLKRMHL